MILIKVWAFLKRDLRINTSYSFSIVFQTGAMLSSLFTFFFIAKLMGESKLLQTYGYGGDYFSFVIIGIAFSKYMSAALGVGDILSEEQEDGALETILLTPTSPGVVVLAGSIYNIIETTVLVVFYLVFGVYFFKMKILDINFLSVFITVILSITSFMGIGLLSSAFVILFKQASPITWLFQGVSKFLGGVFFPIAVLPKWAQSISNIIPTTHALDAVRGALLNGKTVSEIYSELIFLLIFSIIFLPSGIVFLKYSINRCKRTGSLDHV